MVGSKWQDKINEPVFRASNDNGMTFGEKIMLSNASTTTAATTTGLQDTLENAILS
jgi:hypothetical protein